MKVILTSIAALSLLPHILLSPLRMTYNSPYPVSDTIDHLGQQVALQTVLEVEERISREHNERMLNMVKEFNSSIPPCTVANGCLPKPLDLNGQNVDDIGETREKIVRETSGRCDVGMNGTIICTGE